MVLELLPKPALKKTSQASHYMHTLSIPILFRFIDISVKPTIDIYNPGCPRSWLTNIYDTFVNQWRFAQQLLRKPGYASYVRSFTWTMDIEKLQRPFGWIDDRRVVWEPKMDSLMFALLEKATAIDIDTGNRHPDPLSPLQPLFPSAQHIRLGGKMHHALASAILHGPDKAPLHSLTLNNVLERGLLRAKTAFRFLYAVRNGVGLSCNDPFNVTEDWPKVTFRCRLPRAVWGDFWHHLYNVAASNFDTYASVSRVSST